MVIIISRYSMTETHVIIIFSLQIDQCCMTNHVFNSAGQQVWKYISGKVT